MVSYVRVHREGDVSFGRQEILERILYLLLLRVPRLGDRKSSVLECIVSIISVQYPTAQICTQQRNLKCGDPRAK